MNHIIDPRIVMKRFLEMGVRGLARPEAPHICSRPCGDADDRGVLGSLDTELIATRLKELAPWQLPKTLEIFSEYRKIRKNQKKVPEWLLLQTRSLPLHLPVAAIARPLAQLQHKEIHTEAVRLQGQSRLARGGQVVQGSLGPGQSWLQTASGHLDTKILSRKLLLAGKAFYLILPRLILKIPRMHREPLLGLERLQGSYWKAAAYPEGLRIQWPQRLRRVNRKKKYGLQSIATKQGPTVLGCMLLPQVVRTFRRSGANL